MVTDSYGCLGMWIMSLSNNSNYDKHNDMLVLKIGHIDNAQGPLKQKVHDEMH